MAEYRYHIRKIEFPTSDTVVLELSRPDRFISGPADVFNFKPGQYLMLQYRDENGRLTDKHAFSIANSPTDRDHLKLGIRIGGRFTRGLTKMRPGDELIVSGPFGKFVFNEKKHQDLVLIAGGIGITPFLSAMNYATAKELPNKLSLLYSNKTLGGTLFYDEIKRLELYNKNLRALFCVSEKTDINLPAGVINKRITAAVIEDFIINPSGKHFFICGPSAFMSAMKKNLEIVGVQKHQIHMEEFAMIQSFNLPLAFRNAAYAVGLSGALMLVPMYLMLNSSEAMANGGPGSGSIFSSTSPYETDNIYKISKEEFDKIPKQVKIVYRTPEPVLATSTPTPTTTEIAKNEIKEPVKIVKKAAAAKPVKKTVAKKTASAVTTTVKKSSPTTAAKTVAVTTPKPKTEVSPTILAEQQAAAKAAQNNQSQTQSQTTSQTPAPVTSASTAHASTQTATQSSATQTSQQSVATNQNTATTPAPTTHTSTPASSGSTSSGTTSSGTTSSGTTSQTTGTTPAPTTQTSAPASSGSTISSGGGSTTANPAPAPTRHHDDDHEEEDDD